MERRTRMKLVFAAVAVVLMCSLALLHVLVLRPWLDKLAILASIAGTDRVVARTNYTVQGVPVRVQNEYRNPDDIATLIEAIREAPQDNALYDTPVGSLVIEFYRGEVLLETMGTCSGLFLCQDNQYYDKSGRIERLVDNALRAEVKRQSDEDT